MSADQRFLGSLPGFEEGRSLYADEEFARRMDLVRLRIQDVRKAWTNAVEYNALKDKIWGFIRADQHDEVVIGLLEEMLSGFHDYADMGLDRPVHHRGERYPALELYCSDRGYEYLFRLVYRVLRTEQIEEALLLTVVTLVEYLTIDLYNLRLANIGDPVFENFQGVTFRGMRIKPPVAEDYRKVFQNKDLSKRHFSIPLGLISSSVESDVMKQFAQDGNHDPETERMYFTVHVHGLDHDLLALYLSHYPTSVVTTICAMPVGRISPFAEREILLRGAFFHILNMETKVIDGENVHEVVCVIINANRDHTTEIGSNEGYKKVQRDFFRHIAAASRYEVCARLLESTSREDSQAYSSLHKKELEAVRRLQMDNFGIEPGSNDDTVVRNTKLADERSEAKATWLGGSSRTSYPRSYIKLRSTWEDAVANGRWCEVEEILEREYIWSRTEWYHVGRLRSAQSTGETEHEGYTLLHEMAFQGPPNAKDMSFRCWERVLDEISSDESWKTLRTFDDSSKTAHEIAKERGYHALAERLAPRIRNHISTDELEDLQFQVHQVMREKAGELVFEPNFRLPQLSVLTEMKVPSLWVPIPDMFGASPPSMHAAMVERQPVFANSLASPAQLEGSSSVYDGVPEDLERSVRFASTKLVQTAGVLLRLPQDIIATAIVTFTKFWIGPEGGSLREYDATDICAASIFLVISPSPHPRSAKSILNVLSYLRDEKAHKEDTDESIEHYLSEGDVQQLSTKLFTHQSIILRTLGFSLHVALPYTLCVNYIQALDVFQTDQAAGQRLASRAFAHLNAALLNPQLLYLTHQPPALATAAIYLGAREEGIKLPEEEWWEVFDTDREELGFLVVAMLSTEGFAREEEKTWSDRQVPLTVNEINKEIERRATLAEG